MKPLYDLQQELNRLFIAGSKFAKNDPRLQKHVPILKKLGEKAPVFNKLAQEVEVLLQVESTQACRKTIECFYFTLFSALYSRRYCRGRGYKRKPNPYNTIGECEYYLFLFTAETCTTSPLPKATQDVWKYCKMPLNARYLTIHVLMDI